MSGTVTLNTQQGNSSFPTSPQTPSHWNLAKISAIFAETTGKTLKMLSYGLGTYAAYEMLDRWMLYPLQPKNVPLVQIFNTSLYGILPFFESHPWITTFIAYYSGKISVETAERILETDQTVH